MSRPLQNEVRWNDYVTTPLRKYQSRICNVAVGKNTIVVLPTGSGKTLIAATLTSWYQKERRGKTLFLVPTQMLVSQQASAIQSNNNKLIVMKFHGELPWPTNDYDVLVSTPEAYNRKLAAGDPLAQFPRFSLVVFDEVHHVSKKHPYRKLARSLELSSLPRPVVLGLTATCTYAVSESQIGSDITKLCEALAITEVQTASQEELVRDGYHGATPSVQLHLPTAPPPSLPQPIDDIFDIFDSSVPTGGSQFMPHQSREAFFHSLANRTADPIVLRLYAVTQAVENMITRSYLPSFQSPLNTKGKQGKVSEWSSYAMKIKVPASQALAHLYEALRIMVVTNSAGIDLVLEYIRMSIDKSQLVSIGESGPVLQQIISDGGDITGPSTPYMSRFLRLVNVIIAQLDHHRSDQFRGILFVQQRITTHILKNFLDRVPSLSSRLRVACIYATAGEATPFLRVTQSQSKERVGEFAAGRVNLLVATAVAEEGMDVPAANCIIRFDPVHTPVSFIQGRGRARQEESSFVVMDQRADRTVAHLTAAEQAQRSLLERGEVINADQMAAATAKRAVAQKNREKNAKEYVRNAKGNPTAIVKLFCSKSDREITEIFKKTNSGWTAIVSVLGVNGQKWMEEVTTSNKQESKNAAYAKILASLQVSL